MSYKAIRTLIEDSIRGVDDSVFFAHARASDFNTIETPLKKRVHLDSMKETLAFTDNSFFLKQFQVSLIFYKLDDPHGDHVNSTAILDEMDLLSDKFIVKFNRFFSDGDGEDGTKDVVTDKTEISNLKKDPIIKVTKDCMTGFVLQFNVTCPSDLNYCSVYG